MNRCRLSCIMTVLGLSSWLGWAANTQINTPPSADERELKAAGIATDGESLLEYFRRRTPTEGDQQAYRQLVSQLGSSVYTVRVKATDELIKAGRPTLPFLRETAKKADTELSRRARYCIGVIEQATRPSLSAAASRVLAERKREGALAVLLEHLPFVDDLNVEEEIRESLRRLAMNDGKAEQVIEVALSHKHPKCRAAAAWIVGQSIDADQRRLVRGRLTDDSPEVRVLAATALLGSREPASVPALISLLAGVADDIAWRAEDLLFRLAGDSGPTIWLESNADNSGGKVQKAWELWWKSNETKIDWKSFKLEQQSLGLTMVIENQRSDGAGRVYEVNRTGDIRWQHKSHNPIDAQWIPGGRVLVADSRASAVYEMDTRGVIQWKHSGISPTSVQRLPTGNVVLSTYQHILEITREGKTAYSYSTQGHTYHARKTTDGTYIWIDACGEIGEVDAKGNVLGRATVGSGLAWGSIERVRPGRYLIALGGSGKVQEVDMAGKVYWEKAVNNPNRAVRLANGHTLVCSHADQCVYEFDMNGTERWKYAAAGRPFAAQRR